MDTNAHSVTDHDDTTQRGRRILWTVVVAGFIAIWLIRSLTTTDDGPRGSGLTASGVTYQVRGFLTLTGPLGVLVSTSDTIEATGDPVCWGHSQYQDIGYGTVVTIYDDEDSVIAHGALGQGRTGRQGTPIDAACVFPIVVEEVPARSAFYQVEIARRGTVIVQNRPEDGVLYAFVALDDAPDGPLPLVADQPPNIPTVVE